MGDFYFFSLDIFISVLDHQQLGSGRLRFNALFAIVSYSVFILPAPHSGTRIASNDHLGIRAVVRAANLLYALAWNPCPLGSALCSDYVLHALQLLLGDTYHELANVYGSLVLQESFQRAMGLLGFIFDNGIDCI